MPPKKPELKNKEIKVLVTSDEAKAIEAAAKAEDRTISSWVRLALRAVLRLK